jgi:hypothetical protein
MTPQERNARLAEFTPAEWREYLPDAWTAPSDPEVCPRVDGVSRFPLMSFLVVGVG